MFPGFSGNYAILISPALGQQLLCCPKRGTSVPPFLKYGKAGPTVLATPEGLGVSPQTPPPLKRWTKLLRFSPKPKRGLVSQRPSASSAALKRRARLECPGTGRGRALAVSTGAAVAAAPKRDLSSPVTDGLRNQNDEMRQKVRFYAGLRTSSYDAERAKNTSHFIM